MPLRLYVFRFTFQDEAMKHPRKRSNLTRRSWLQSMAGIAAGAVVSGCAQPSAQSTSKSRSRRDGSRLSNSKSNLIQRENAQAGTRDWLLTKTRVDPASKYRSPWIEGYCSRTSTRAGDELDIFVSTNPASEFNLDIYRMGFYGGTGARGVASKGPFHGRVQPEPAVGPNRLRECQWEPCLTLKIPTDW